MAALDDQPYLPNSLEAIQANLQSGAEFIEVDINALANGDYLLVHESELEAETSGQGRGDRLHARKSADIIDQTSRGQQPAARASAE